MKKRICKVVGCGVVLYPRNGTGLCRAHKHEAGYCRCIQCEGDSAVAQVAARPAVARQTYLVPYATSNSGVSGVALVSLPFVPWVGDRLGVGA